MSGPAGLQERYTVRALRSMSTIVLGAALPLPARKRGFRNCRLDSRIRGNDVIENSA